MFVQSRGFSALTFLQQHLVQTLELPASQELHSDGSKK